MPFLHLINKQNICVYTEALLSQVVSHGCIFIEIHTGKTFGSSMIFIMRLALLF